jgi:hypothetical protein
MSLFFPDVSHYQAGLSLKGAPAVIAKATQGTSYIDPVYDVFRVGAQSLGIPFCAYHWLDTSAATAQAKHCFNIVGPHTPLMIDDEQQRIVVEHTLEFVAAYRALGGRVILEYAPAWVWRNSGRPNLIPFARAGLGIVSSSYTAYSDIGVGWAPYGGVTPIIWQYSDNHLFNGRRVDFNAYRGSSAQLAALFGGSGGDMPLTKADVELFWNTDVPGDAENTSGGNMLRQARAAAQTAAAKPPVVAGPVDAAALKTALMSPEVLAAIAKAVNDDSAARQRE